MPEGRPLLQNLSRQLTEILSMMSPKGGQLFWMFGDLVPGGSKTCWPTSPSGIPQLTATGREQRTSQAQRQGWQRRKNRQDILPWLGGVYAPLPLRHGVALEKTARQSSPPWRLPQRSVTDAAAVLVGEDWPNGVPVSTRCFRKVLPELWSPHDLACLGGHRRGTTMQLSEFPELAVGCTAFFFRILSLTSSQMS